MIPIYLKSVIFTSKHSILCMMETGAGSIINNSSITPLRSPNTAPEIAYAASKGEMILLTRIMAVHHGRNGMRVDSIVSECLYASMVTKVTEE